MKEKKKEKKKKQLPQKETDRKSNEMSQSGPGRSRTFKAMLIDASASKPRHQTHNAASNGQQVLPTWQRNIHFDVHSHQCFCGYFMEY